ISKKYIFDVKKVELSTDTSSSNLKIKLGLSTLMVPLEQLFRNDIEKKIFYDKWDINPSEQKISTPTNCNYLVIGIEYSNNNIGKINSLECLQYL
ncbi:hypothetical protein KC678_00275, partial [Candidatus Dojkabacteria bacterium]|nr:hypothetical protein [Candidatus Dojkabacteria bacterium]